MIVKTEIYEGKKKFNETLLLYIYIYTDLENCITIRVISMKNVFAMK